MQLENKIYEFSVWPFPKRHEIIKPNMLLVINKLVLINIPFFLEI